MDIVGAVLVFFGFVINSFLTSNKTIGKLVVRFIGFSFSLVGCILLYLVAQSAGILGYMILNLAWAGAAVVGLIATIIQLATIDD